MLTLLGLKHGLVTGTVISIFTAIITLLIQHSLTVKEKTIQLYLDEKNNFVVSCEEYLKQYRHWHEMMNYLVSLDTTNNSKISEFKDFQSFIDFYLQWKKDIDYAYGKIFLLSNNEFCMRTMEVSTVLTLSIKDVIVNNYDEDRKQSILNEVDNYFFSVWLTKAQEEIFRFNTGKRIQKTMSQFLEEQRKLIEIENNDSLKYQFFFK